MHVGAGRSLGKLVLFSCPHSPSLPQSLTTQYVCMQTKVWAAAAAAAYSVFGWTLPDPLDPIQTYVKYPPRERESLLSFLFSEVMN